MGGAKTSHNYLTMTEVVYGVKSSWPNNMSELVCQIKGCESRIRRLKELKTASQDNAATREFARREIENSRAKLQCLKAKLFDLKEHADAIAWSRFVDPGRPMLSCDPRISIVNAFL